jgi:hypothetical protein
MDMGQGLWAGRLGPCQAQNRLEGHTYLWGLCLMQGINSFFRD